MFDHAGDNGRKSSDDGKKWSGGKSQSAMFLIKVMGGAQVLTLEKDGIFSVVKPGAGFASEPVTGNISQYGGDNECAANGEY